MKKTLALLLSALLFLSLLAGCSKEPVSDDPFVQDPSSVTDDPYADIPETSVEEFELGIHEEYVAIRQYTGESKTVKIPEEIDGKPVTIVGSGAFIKTDIEAVLLPDSVTEIRSRAFQNCEQLRDVWFSNTLVKIESYAFYNCKSLRAVAFPSTLTSIGSYAFADCINLVEAQINGTNLMIDEAAFSQNQSLKALILNGVKHIGWGAFSKAINLETVTIPETVEIIDGVAFANCEKLKSVTFLGDIPESIDEYTFKATTIIPTLYYKKDAAGTENPMLSVYNLEEYE